MPPRDRRKTSDLPLPVRVALLEARQAEFELELERLEESVDQITTEDKIRAGVRRELQAREPLVASATAARVATVGAPLRLSLPQKIGGAVAGAILVIDAVRGFVGL